VRRNTLSRATAIIDAADDEAARNRELRRLRAEIQRLEEEKEDLTRRLGFVERELENTRAKVPRGMSTSRFRRVTEALNDALDCASSWRSGPSSLIGGCAP